MKTDQDRIKFISELTLINGKKNLVSVVPEIEQVLAEYRAQSNADGFNFGQLRIPVNLNRKVQGYWDEDGNYVANDDMYYDNQAIANELREAIQDAFISYGYDPEVAQEWLREKEASWEDLQEASDN